MCKLFRKKAPDTKNRDNSARDASAVQTHADRTPSVSECIHDWVAIRSVDHGEMDYCSYGGPVDRYVVTLYRCSICGALKKEGTGDYLGDPSELLEIDEDDLAWAGEKP